jgi:hypothetical protein
MITTIGLAELSMLLAGSGRIARHGASARHELAAAHKDSTLADPADGWRCGGPHPFATQGTPGSLRPPGNAARRDGVESRPTDATRASTPETGRPASNHAVGGRRHYY